VSSTAAAAGFGSDRDLVAACRAGDQQAWGLLVRQYSPLVWTIARSHRLSPSDCEDVYQVTWMRVVQRLGSLHTPDRLSAWITTVARRECLKQLPRTAKHVPIGAGAELELTLPPTGNAPESRALQAEQHRLLMDAFRGLPARDQTLLALLASDPPTSYDDVAAAMGIARGSVGPLRARALVRLRSLLDGYADEAAHADVVALRR